MLKRAIWSLLALAAVMTLAHSSRAIASLAAKQAGVPNDVFAGGSLSLARSGRGAVLALRNAEIGSMQTGAVTITNTGSMAAAILLIGSSPNNALSRQLRLAIYAGVDRDHDHLIYRGRLSGFASERAGKLPPGGQRRFFFHLRLPTTGSQADDTLAGLSATPSFSWRAIET